MYLKHKNETFIMTEEDLKAFPEKMITLLEPINKGLTVLPEFQRDFVWKPKDTKALLISILRNFPAGTLLILRNETGGYGLATREIEDAPKAEKPEKIVLDGQQRLTALYHAFYGKGEYRFFLDLTKLSENIIEEDTIQSFENEKIKSLGYDRAEKQFELKLMPFEAIFKDHNGYKKDWKTDFVKYYENSEKKGMDAFEFFTKIESYIEQIKYYRFAVTELSDKLPISAICQIFETLNSKGIRLGVFELLTATLYQHDIKLRELWETTLEYNKILQDYDVDSVEILKTISLITTSQKLSAKSQVEPSCRRNDILKLSHIKFNENWNIAVKFIVASLSQMNQEFGIKNKKWLPYEGMISPMSAMLWYSNDLKGVRKSEANKKIISWFWRSIFNKTYDSSTDTQTAIDFKEMIEWINDNTKIPETVKKYAFDPSTLKNITKQNDSIYKGIICLLMRNHAIDFESGKEITTELLSNNSIDDHHIFPRKYLENIIPDKNLIECVLNKTLLSSVANKRIGKKAPSVYLKLFISENKPDEMVEKLNSHFIAEDSKSAIFKDDFRTFIEERIKMISKSIDNVTSI